MARDISEVEKSLVGTLLYSPDRIADALRLGVRADWFEVDAWSLLFSACVELDAAGASKVDAPSFALSALDLAQRIGKRDKERRDASGLNVVKAEEAMDAASFGGVETAARLLAEAFKERKANELMASVREEMAKSTDVSGVLLRLRSEAEKLAEIGVQDATPDEVTWYELQDPPKEEEDDNVLLLGGYFRRGHALFIVSTSGAGKSVLVNQLALNLALGREWLGMRPRRALRVGVIQAEDDVEEMADFRRNLRIGLASEYGWTAADIDAALKNVSLATKFKGKTAENFVERLRGWQRRNKFDVIIMNPLFAYFGGNLSDSKDCTRFFREWLDPLMCDSVYGFGLIVVHHTTKPPKGDERKNWAEGDFAQYLGAGGTDVAGWSRASFLLFPVSGCFGWFRLIATKRGNRLDWRNEAGERVREKILRYGETAIYWRAPKAEEIPADVKKAASIDAKPKEVGEIDARTKMLAHLRVKPMEKTEFWDWCTANFKGLTSRSEVPAKLAYQDIVNNPEKYGLELVKAERGRAKVIRFKNDLPGMDLTPQGGEAVAAGPRVGDYDLDGGGDIEDVIAAEEARGL